MLPAVLGLAIDVAAILQPLQQLRNGRGTHLMADRAQRRRQLLVALRDPPQRAHRIAHRRRLEHALQVAEQRCVLGRGRWPAGAFPTHLACQRTRLQQVLDATTDGAPRDLGGTRRSRYPAIAGADGFRRHVQPPTTLIEQWPDSLVPGTDGVLIDHEPTIRSAYHVGNRSNASLSNMNRLFLGVALERVLSKDYLY